MAFWIFMMVMDLLVPLTMVGYGTVYRKKAPSNMNAAAGYRTNRSMMNRDTWEFAHKHVGRLWFRCGIVLLPISILVMCPVIGGDDNTVGTVGGILCAVQTFFFIGAIWPTERALKRTFDENGYRRQ